MRKVKTIKGKILVSVITLLSISMLVLGGTAIAMLYSSSQATLDQTLTEMASLAAERVEQEILVYKNIAFEVGSIARLSNEETSLESKQELVDIKVKTYNLIEANVFTKDGISIFNQVDASEREYFKRAMNGETFISEPSVSKTTGKTSIFISAPLWEKGIPNTRIVGVVLLIPQEDFLDSIVDKIRVSENSGAYIIDDNGTTVAHTTKGMVESQNNSIEKAKKDSSLKLIAELETKMINGENGFGSYKYGGDSKFLAYAPIASTDGWSIGITAFSSDFMDTTVMAIVLTVVIMAVALVIAFIIIRRIAENIGSPIKKCADRLNLLAKGDLKSPTVTIDSNDETGILAEATSGIVMSMNTIIGDISYLMGEMADGNFALSTQAENAYIGDYENIILSVRRLNRSLSSTLMKIDQTAHLVSLGADQMADAATSLAEGTTDQAGAIEELLATVSEVTDKAEENSKEAAHSSNEAKIIGKEAQESSIQMQHMIEAMQKISDASKEIGNIIGTIEDIATETNLLSLNASIEAARAGELGKGFAVVAGEIGDLAKQSAKAVEDTRILIDAALSEVSAGNKMVDTTSSTIQAIITRIDDVVESVEKVALAFDYQADAISQINQGVEQISGVVQNNSATAEETSATSEELSTQATIMDNLVKQFKLRKDDE